MIDWEQEILLIDKPVGITSFDVIRRLRHFYSDTHDGAKAPKIGHAGTLDPLASGLMVLGVGRGTKKLAELTKLDKEYVASIRLGESRTTGDLEGEVVDERVVEEIILPEIISSTLTSMLGTHTYTVSAYSAIKKDGVPMYKRVRKAEAKGETLAQADLPQRDMTVYEAELLHVKKTDIEGKTRSLVTVRFNVGSGTYIRSLAEAFGQKLGYPACLEALKRTKVGDFSVEETIVLPLKQK